MTQAVTRMTDAVSHAAETCRQAMATQASDSVVVVAGVPFGRHGSTNALRVVSIGDAGDD